MAADSDDRGRCEMRLNGAIICTIFLPLLLDSQPAGRTGYHILGEWLGQGIATSDGPHWRRNRKIVTPFFQSNCVRKHHVPVINKV